MTDDDFDYQAYMRENPPDPAKITRGIKARDLRRDAAINANGKGVFDGTISN